MTVMRKRLMPQVCMCTSGSMLSYFQVFASVVWAHEIGIWP